MRKQLRLLLLVFDYSDLHIFIHYNLIGNQKITPKKLNMMQEAPSPMKQSKVKAQGINNLDLRVIFGEEGSYQQLIDLDANLFLDKNDIANITAKANLKEPVGNDAILKFDFITQEGRQKEVLEYFQNGLDQNSYDYLPHLSPLQNWFKRPKNTGTLELTEKHRKDGKGEVNLTYRFYQQIIQEDEQFSNLINTLLNSEIKPDLNVKFLLKGNLQIVKKGRIYVKADYANLRVTSKRFKTSQITYLLNVLKLFGEEQEQSASLTSNPIFKLIQKAEQIQLQLHMTNFRRFFKTYQLGAKNTSTQYLVREKEPPQVIEGLFKEKVKFTLIYGDRLAVEAECLYANENVFIRLLSVYRKHFLNFTT